MIIIIKYVCLSMKKGKNFYKRKKLLLNMLDQLQFLNYVTIDILLLVEDSRNEDNYVPFLEKAGYVFRIREPHWYEHRMFKGKHSEVNLYVFFKECQEAKRMIAF